MKMKTPNKQEKFINLIENETQIFLIIRTIFFFLIIYEFGWKLSKWQGKLQV